MEVYINAEHLLPTFQGIGPVRLNPSTIEREQGRVRAGEVRLASSKREDYAVIAVCSKCDTV